MVLLCKNMKPQKIRGIVKISPPTFLEVVKYDANPIEITNNKEELFLKILFVLWQNMAIANGKTILSQQPA